MTTATLPASESVSQMLVVTDAQIAAMREKLMGLKINGLSDKAGYQLVSAERKKVKAMRVELDKRRYSLNEDARNWINTVNGEAKRLTKALEEIETHLETEEKAYDDAKKAIALESARQAKLKLQSRVDALTAVRGAIDIEALQTLSDAEFSDILAQATNAFQQAEAARIEREALQALGRTRASALAKVGDVVEPEEAARWDESVFALRLESSTFEHEQREIDAKAARDRQTKLAERTKQINAHDIQANMDFIATCSDEEFAAIIDKAKADKEARKAREETGRSRAKTLAYLGDIVDPEEAGNWNLEAYQERYHTAKAAFDQRQAEKEKADREAEARRKLGAERAEKMAPFAKHFSAEALGNFSQDEFDALFDLTKERHERALADKAEADRKAAEQAEADKKAADDKAKAERLAAEKKRQEEIDLARPDAELMMSFLMAVGNVPGPSLQSEEALVIMKGFDVALNKLIEETKVKIAKMIA